MHVYHLRWIAKLNFNANVSYEFRELRQFGKFLTDLPGVGCAWVHPKTDEKYSLLVKFDKYRVPSKKFFNPQGFHSWDDINSQYQGKAYQNQGNAQWVRMWTFEDFLVAKQLSKALKYVCMYICMYKTKNLK